MQEQLQEIEGTLARSKERRNTILYKLAKRRREAERLARLGLTALPRSPFDVSDPAVARHVLFQIKQEVGEKMARLRNVARCSVAKDGEEAVRAANDEVNRLLARKAQWQARLAFLQGEEPERQPASLRKQYFGAAKELPEAQCQSHDDAAAVERGGRESDGVADETLESSEEEEQEVPGLPGAVGHCGYLQSIMSLRGSDVALRAAERRSEEEAQRQCKAVRGEHASIKTSARDLAQHTLVLSYMHGGILRLPTEETYRQRMIEERRAALQARLRETRKAL